MNQKENLVPRTHHLPKDLLQQVDQLAKINGLKKGEAVRQLLSLGLEALEQEQQITTTTFEIKTSFDPKQAAFWGSVAVDGQPTDSMLASASGPEDKRALRCLHEDLAKELQHLLNMKADCYNDESKGGK